MKYTNVVCPDKEIVNNLSVSFEDGFEVITMYGRPLPNQATSLYPQTTNLNPAPPSNLPYAVTPNVPVFTPNTNAASNVVKQRSSHPLDGIPFKLSPALEMSSSLGKDPVLEDVKDTLSRVGRLLHSDEFNYDFSLERDVLRGN